MFQMKPVHRATALLLLCSAILSSCDSADYRRYSQNYSANPASVFAKFDQPSAVQTVRNPAHGRPGHRCDLPEGAPLPSTPVSSFPSSNETATVVNRLDSTASTTTALNPPHGKPGHRCEIAVGAPLNSAPATRPQAVNNSTTTANLSASGLNPQHGQPGHRCDIAVGAPLSTPLAVKKDTAKALPAGNSPLKADSLQTTLVTDSNGHTVRLNPPHGQPGHDCRIPVGKPLEQ